MLSPISYLNFELLIRPLLFSVLILLGCSDNGTPPVSTGEMQITAFRVGTESILNNEIDDAPTDQPVVVTFSVPVEPETISTSIILSNMEMPLEWDFSLLDDNRTISIMPLTDFDQNTPYTIEITNQIRGSQGHSFRGLVRNFRTINPPLRVVSVALEQKPVDLQKRITNVPLAPTIDVHFSEPLSTSDLEGNVYLTSRGNTITPALAQTQDSIVSFTFDHANLAAYTKYRFYLSSTLSVDDKDFDGYEFEFYTQIDSTFKFPEISDDELLSKVQSQTFKYFWEFAHPVSGLARERNSSGNTVTIGGSGFGLMAIIVGIERGLISRQQGIERLTTIVNFLGNEADRFHGVWSHWLHGETGNVIPFSADDDGGDLVETAFMIQGLITVRQYLTSDDAAESALIDKINALWQEVEWDWYRQGDQNVLYWHWSPKFGWAKNHKIQGWNESLIVYVLAAGSPTHGIPTEVYSEGWTRSGDMRNGNNYYEITLPLGSARGGPLFFSHYSFLGLDPRNLEDQYADYWTQNVAHSLINYAYSVDNPKNFVGYSTASWGLTASDNHEGYSAHSPENDLGVITPTAAISSLPYTPEESMRAIRHFYYILGDKLWGEYGFYDAFNITEGWYADSYLAIDQGPIICMIENHRTGLLWDLFMSAPEIQSGLTTLGFTYE